MCTAKRRVVVTGVGVISPIGNSKKEFWTALLQGKNGADRLKAFDPSKFTTQIAAEVKDFDPLKHFPSAKEIRHMDRFVQFALVTAKEAFADSGLDMQKEDPNRCGVVIGSGIGGLHTFETQHLNYLEKGPSRISPFLIPMLIVNMASGEVSISLGFKGPNSCVATACASGNHAIGDALRLIQRNDADIMITGGAEGCITPMGFGGFCSCKALSRRNNDPKAASRPFDKERDGFVMGEGAGLLIVEEYERAKKRGANIYCEISGYGMSGDAYHITAPDPDGEGGRRCMENAVIDAGVNPNEVDYINAHGTSTPMNDKVETLAIKRLFKDHAKKLMVSSTKSMTGHLLGAAGGVEAIACAMGIKEGVVPQTTNYQYPDPECDLDYVPNTPRKKQIKVALSNSLGFGGHNATIVLRKI
ncbi:MAG: beta-ketoacyl-ACP synthase II [Candidatus Omnitrophica bacterium]|nr:beta-ketoacyl-ACP synthase II [Candidatus Omnitrophota bacterium]